MIEMTGQERRAALFLSLMVIAAAGLNLYFKAFPRQKEVFQIEELNAKVNLNLALEKELLSVKGIGPVTAANIIAYRDNYGPFRHLEELKQVKGISEYRYNLLKDHLCLE